MSLPKLRVRVPDSSVWTASDTGDRFSRVEFGRQVFRRVHESSTLDGTQLEGSPAIVELVEAVGAVVMKMMNGLVIEPADGATLETADVEVLERAFTAIGAELERRKAAGEPR